MQTREEIGKNISDHYNMLYIEAAQAAKGKPRHIPAGSGSANNGSNLGVSVLNSNNVLSNVNPNYGSALAHNIPINAIMEWSYHGKWQQGDYNNTNHRSRRFCRRVPPKGKPTSMAAALLTNVVI